MKSNQVSKRVTLKDIAKETGFSVNTISHALKDQDDISEKTKKLICDTAKKMGYIRNSSAVFLRSGESKSIAIILGDLSNPLFAIMINEIEILIKKEGYVSFVINTSEDPKTERRALEMALEKNVDGIILCPSPGGEDNIDFLQKSGVPFVLHGRYFRDKDTNAVLYDDQACGYLAGKHLIEQGHRELLFVNAPSSVSSAQERFRGCRDALEQYQVGNVTEAPISLCPQTRLKELKKVLQPDNKYTAIIAFSDMIAFEVICVLEERGMRVPEDVSVVGFDNIQSNYLFPTQLTTVASSKKQMVAKSVDLLLGQIRQRGQGNLRVLIPAKLRVRKTTSKLV